MGYNSSTQSNILVTVHSTLGFEMLGAGRKVLFGASIDDFALAKFWGAVENFNKLPSLNLLDSFYYDKKILGLIIFDKKKITNLIY